MSLNVEILWPPKLAIVFWRSQQPGKVLEPSESLVKDDQVAYQVGFSREAIIWKTAEIPEGTPKEIPAISHSYKCPLWGAYYLPRVIVRPLEGKMLPKGNLCVHLDGQLIADGQIAAFIPDLEGINCLESHSWRPTTGLFRAHTLTNVGADGDHQIGFMLPNLSKVEVRLTDVTTEEKMTLEIGLLSAYYSTKVSEIKDEGKKP